MRLAGEVAVIGGSTKGMGLATAELFAREGAKVVLSGRSADRGAAIERRLRGDGHDVRYVCVDLSREADVRRMIDTATSEFGKLTILVNNAAPTELTVGIDALDGRVEDITTERFRTVFDGVFMSAFWGCKYAIPEIARAGGGAIVNVSSIGGMLGLDGQVAYSSAKSAIFALTRSVAVETAARNIRANCVTPGAVPTELSARLTADPAYDAALRSLQLTRLGLPEDIAYTALFLASKESAFITGLMMPVDGGATARLPLPPTASVQPVKKVGSA